MKTLLFVLCALLVLIVVAPAQAQEDTSSVSMLQELQSQFSVDGAQPTASADVVTIETRLPDGGVRPGTSFEAFVYVRVATGWHVNAHQPTSDYLIGTQLTLEAQAGIEVTEMYYPDPLFRHFEFSHDTLAVYEGDVPIILAVHAAASIQPGTHPVPGTLRVQACNDQICLRPSTVEVSIPIQIVK